MSSLRIGILRAAVMFTPDTTDGELLARFLTNREHAAFAELLRRHGKMVFGTCQRVLGNAADADDAFQAAFVVLVRKAHTLTERPCIGNFLYTTAVFTARKARTMATRRRTNEAKARRIEPVVSVENDTELTQILDEELAKLPEKYREPVVLCELEGFSRREAARRIGIPEGTISSRLATAHRMLAKRLSSRGFTLALAAVLARRADAVPVTLMDATVQAVTHVPSPRVTQLVSEVTKMILFNKLQPVAMVMMALMLLIGIGYVQQAGPEATAAPIPKDTPIEGGLIWTYHYKTGELVAYTSEGQKAKSLKLKDCRQLRSFTPDGTKLVFLGRNGRLVEANDDQPGLSIHLREINESSDGVDTGIAYQPRDQFIWSPDGKKVVRVGFAANQEFALRSIIRNSMVDLETRKEIPLRLGHDQEQVIAWSPDGKWLLTTHYSDSVKNGEVTYHLTQHHCFDLEKGISTPLGENGQLYAGAFSPDGRSLFGQKIESRESVAAGLKDLSMVRTDITTGKSIEIARHEDQSFASIRCSPSGKRVAYLWHKRSAMDEAILTIIDPDGKNPKNVTIPTLGGTANEIALLGWFPVPSPIDERKDDAKDEDLLQGKWQAVAAESDGKEVPDQEALKAIVLMFKGNEVTFPGNMLMTYTLDLKSKPKGLNLTPSFGPNKGMTMETAIYELNGNDLKLCIDWGRNGNPVKRPQEFKTAPLDGRIALKLKRVVEEKKVEKKDEPKKTDDAKRILGKWVQTSFAVVPNDNTIDPLAQQTLTFTENGLRTEYWVNEGDPRQTTDSQYELNPTAQPKELTIRGKESKVNWIYELDGDKLKMAVLNDGSRPKSFLPGDIPEGRKLKFYLFTRARDEKKSQRPKEWSHLDCSAAFQRMAVSPDGEMIATVGISNRTGKLFDSIVNVRYTKSGKMRWEAEWDTDSHIVLAFSKDYVAAGINGLLSDNKRTMREVRLHEATSGTVKHTIKDSLITRASSLTALSFSPDGTQLAIAGIFDNSTFLTVWNLQTKKFTQEIASLNRAKGVDNTFTMLVYSPDGKKIAAGCDDGMIRLYDGTTLKSLATLDPGPGSNQLHYGSNGIIFSQDGQSLVSLGSDQGITRWNLTTQKGTSLDKIKGTFKAISLSPNGKWIATADKDEVTFDGKRKVKIWDALTGTLQRSINDVEATVNGLAFTSDSQSLITCAGHHEDAKNFVKSTGQMRLDHVVESTSVPVEPKKEQPKKVEDAEQILGANQEWKARFLKDYSLKDDEQVKRIAPPYPDSREDYFHDRLRRIHGRKPTEDELKEELNQFTVFQSKNGNVSSSWQTHTAPEEGVSLQFVLGTVLELHTTRIQDNANALNQKVTGDFVLRTGVDRKNLSSQLEGILRNEIGLKVKLTYKEVEEEVFVLGGTYAAKPLEGRRIDQIELYTDFLSERNVGGGGVGTFDMMVESVERHVNQPIVIDKVEGRPARLFWHINYRDLRDKTPDTHPLKVLENIASQTGLSVKREKRMIQKLVIEPVE